MNLKKRGLALLMCICMIMTLLPVAAFADDSAVVYGQYENGEWVQDPNADGIVTSDNITLSKTAEPVPGSADTYKVDLKVVTTTTTTSVAPGSAATVLVIDVSGSMDYCAECGAETWHSNSCKYYNDGWFANNSVQTNQQRLAVAKSAAISFLDSYKGDTSGAGRYVSLVSFSNNSSVETDWIDVSTADGYNQVVAALNRLSASGGTNTQSGLKTAKSQLDKPAVSSVAANAKNAVLLTDGIPTFGDGTGDGTSNSSRISKDTQSAAASLKQSAKLYTVCFGAARDTVYLPDGGSDTCGNFLENYVASNETDKTYAYNANNTAELNAAFAAITQDITSGITSGLKVTDSAGQNIDMTAPSEYISVENGFEWTLSDPVVTTDGNKTIYTYSVSYIVKLDTSAEGFVDGKFYPTNGDTYLTYTDADGNEKTLNFEIPGVKGTAPRYTVTYNRGANGALDGQDASGNVVTDNIKIHSATPAAPAVTPDEGYYFTGWDKEIAETVTADVTYTAQYEAKNEITVKANSGEFKYDGTEKNVSGLVSDTFTVNGQTYKVEGLSASVSGTDAGSYANIITGTPVVKDASGADVTDCFTVKTENGTLAIAKRVVVLSSESAEKTYDGTALTNDKITVSGDGFVEGEGAAYDVTGSQLIPGSSDNEFTYTLNEGTKASNYSISKNFGTLKVNDRADADLFEITVKANSASDTYDGNEKSVSGFETLKFTVEGQNYTVEGLSASAKGTDAGTYPSVVKGTAIVKDANGNDVTKQFNVKTVDGALVINPISTEVVVTITGNHASKVYNGSEQSVTGFTTDVGDKDITVALADGVKAEAKGTNVGNYKMGLTEASFNVSSKNYNNIKVVVVDGYLDITPVTDEVVVTITGNHASKVYNGSEQSVTGFTTDVGDKDITVALADGAKAEAKGTNVGNYKMGLTEDSFNVSSKNYNNIKVVVVDGYLDITPVTDEVVVTITGNHDSKVYNGSEQSVTGFTTDVGDKDITVALADGAKAEAKGTNVGNYKMDLTEDSFNVSSKNYSNIKVVVVDGYLYITKAELPVSFTGESASKAYTGSEQEITGITAAGLLNGHTYAGLTYSAKGTTAGEYDGAFSGSLVIKDANGADVTENYVVTKAPGKLTITQAEAELKITANSNSWVYDGKEHADGGYTVSFGSEKYEVKAGESATLSTGDTVTAVVTNTVKHVSDTAEGNNVITKLTVSNVDSYKTVAQENGTLAITAAPLTITAGSSSEPYINGIVICNEYSNTPLVDGDKIASIKITGEQNGPGRSDNVPSDAVIKNAAGEDVTKDYAIKYVNGVLEGIPILEKGEHFNYIMGYKDGTIRPNNNITRAEVATIFFRLFEDSSRDYFWAETNDFTDVSDKYWASPAISTLTNAGILKGFTDGTFRPNDPVTRAQMATIIARFAKLTENKVTFEDIQGHWAQEAIELAAGNGWINGYEDKTFRPNEKITRAATMAMINRVLERHVENVEALLPDMNVWTDNMDPSYTFYFDIQEATNYHECERIDNSPNEKWTAKLEDIDWTKYEF